MTKLKNVFTIRKKAAIIQIGLLVVIVSEILLTKRNRVSGENMMDEWMDRRTNPQISASKDPDFYSIARKFLGKLVQ